MSVEPVSVHRPDIETIPGGFVLAIPARRQWFTVVFLSVWLGFWFLGESQAASQLLAGGEGRGRPFLLFWLVFWTLGGAMAMATLLWTLAGRERLRVERGVLVHEHLVGPVGRRRRYDLAAVRRLRLVPTVDGWGDRVGGAAPFGVGTGGGPLAFDYGDAVVRFGQSLAEGEARAVLRALRQRGLPVVDEPERLDPGS